jgi:hypothetical protein
MAEGQGTMADCEKLARIFNGGPFGYRKKATLMYWYKIRAELAKQAKNK